MAGLVLDGLELQSLSAGYWFDVVSGGPDDLAEWVGEDDSIPGAAGREPGAWTAATRPIKLHGIVFGAGSTPAAVRASYRSRMAALATKMSPASTKALVAHPSNFGLSSGTTATLSSLRPERINGEDATDEMVRQMTLELRSIASPPDWVIA